MKIYKNELYFSKEFIIIKQQIENKKLIDSQLKENLKMNDLDNEI